VAVELVRDIAARSRSHRCNMVRTFYQATRVLNHPETIIIVIRLLPTTYSPDYPVSITKEVFTLPKKLLNNIKTRLMSGSLVHRIHIMDGSYLNINKSHSLVITLVERNHQVYRSVR
jgi:hypothetical protein